MKIKLSKKIKNKIIISTLGILIISIVVPIVLLNNLKYKNKDKVIDIISKIKNKNILIPPNVSTQNQSEIQSAIKNQLQKENQFLTSNDLSKISTNLSSLTLGNKIEVTLTIKINSINQNLKIYVEKANLLNSSNITNGFSGTIFQDEFKNLWTMGYGTKLQVLEVNSLNNGYESAWSDNNQGLLNGSNITDGFNGTIFQDKFKNLWTMGNKTKLQVLKTNSSKTGYVNEGWTDDACQQLLKYSNIIDGNGGIIFQDFFGNLWTMGNEASLQVLRVNLARDGYVNEGWTNNISQQLYNVSQGLINNSNITDGHGGIIFQDEFKNLWTMGFGTKFQVLKINSDKTGYESAWSDDNTQGLLNGSNIAFKGNVFQDKFKNLWTMSAGKKLQVLKVNSLDNGYESSWSNDNSKGLLNGSNITDGNGGIIFQDSFGNLWAMGGYQKLQVLKVNQIDGAEYEKTWVNDENVEELLKNSNITNANGGTIFQDKFKNLWTMGNGTKLQVLKVNLARDGYVNEGWTNNISQELLNGANIINGNGGMIFQDFFGNLWVASYKIGLQVFKVNINKNGYVNSWQN